MGYSTIEDGFWTDPEVLKLTPNQKVVFLWLISNPLRHYTGLYVLHKEVLVKETGCSAQNTGSHLDHLEKKGFICLDNKLSIVWVINMFHYQTGRASKLSPQQLGGLKKHLSDGKLHDTPLIPLFCRKYAYLGVPMLTPTDTPMDTPIDRGMYTPYGTGIDKDLIKDSNIYIDEQTKSSEVKDSHIALKERESIPPAAAAPTISPRDLIALYNDINPHGRKADTLVTDKRLEKARVRFQVFPDRDFWLTVFNKVKESGFLRCANGNRWNGGRGADLDWLLLNDQNPAKVWEGRYDDSERTSGGGESPDPYAKRTRTLET